MNKQLQTCFKSDNSGVLVPTTERSLNQYPVFRESDSTGSILLLELENKYPGNGDGWKGMKLVYVLTSFFKQPFSYYEHNVRSCGKIIERTFQKFRDCIGIQSRNASPRSQVFTKMNLASGATILSCNI